MLLLPGAKTGRLSETDYRQAEIVRRKMAGSRRGEVNYLYIYVLQTPLMLLVFSVLIFVAGLCATVFSPLAYELAWDDDAKVRDDTSLGICH